MHKIVTIVGARPQFVKAAVVSRALQQIEMNEILIHTGQHYSENMSDIFFQELQIPEPKYNLNVKETSHAAMTAKMMIGLEELLVKEKPSTVLLYGDTNSTLAAAITAAKLNVPIAHVEAGLRSFNMAMPEEINRIITDKLSRQLFCPTIVAMNNLNKEGFAKSKFHRLYLTGDVMLDAVKYYYKLSKESCLASLQLRKNDFIVATFHRAELTNDPNNLLIVIRALNEINRHCRVVTPIHPRTNKLIHQCSVAPSFTIIEPVGYFDMLQLVQNSKLVVTDSGGLQKEAHFLSKYVVVVREQTEWTELVENGYAFLTGYNENKIVQAVRHFQDAPLFENSTMYGDGHAGEKIASLITEYISTECAYLS